jgi:uncharacterized protein YndB with AHSA1/START domain
MVKSIFKKDLESNKMFITREFSGSVQEVWEAFTDRHVLDQWWAPLPWKARTKSMDFRNGGEWVYAMEGPEGEVHWAKANYSNIVPLKSFEMNEGFCDDNGNENTELPTMHWKTNFKPAADGATRVEIEITFASQKDLETIVAMGFQEGFTAAHENLDRLLESKAVLKK